MGLGKANGTIPPRKLWACTFALGRDSPPPHLGLVTPFTAPKGNFAMCFAPTTLATLILFGHLLPKKDPRPPRPIQSMKAPMTFGRRSFLSGPGAASRERESSGTASNPNAEPISETVSPETAEAVKPAGAQKNREKRDQLKDAGYSSGSLAWLEPTKAMVISLRSVDCNYRLTGHLLAGLFVFRSPAKSLTVSGLNTETRPFTHLRSKTLS